MATPQPPAKDVKATIHAEWQGAAPQWKKWYAKLAWQSRGATELVVRGAALSTGLHVLDLASGTGEPALSIAKAVGPTGRVVATDMVPEMLEGALAQPARRSAVRKVRVFMGSPYCSRKAPATPPAASIQSGLSLVITIAVPLAAAIAHRRQSGVEGVHST